MPTTRTGSKSKTQTAAVEDSNVVNKIGDDTPPWGTEPAEEKKRYKPKAFKPDQMVTVRNGFQGELLYKSKKTGEIYKWEEFGSDQDMEISELKSAKSSSKKFFINNWFLFDDPEVVDYLGVSQYYKYALNAKNFDSLFDYSPDEIEERVAKLSNGQKKSVAYRAKQLIADGVIDSNRKISALEKSLGVELIER